MKKLTTLIIFVCFSFFTFAQETNTNKYFVGGSINFLYTQNNYGIYGITASGLINANAYITHQTLIGLRPSIGMKINNSWNLGVNLEYLYGHGFREDAIISTTSSGIIEEDLRNISHGFGLGFWGRYQVFSNKKLSPFIQPKVGGFRYQSATKHGTEVVDRQRVQAIGFGSSFGFLYNFEEQLRFLLYIGNLNADFGTMTDIDDDISTPFTNIQTDFRPHSYSIGVEWRF